VAPAGLVRNACFIQNQAEVAVAVDVRRGANFGPALKYDQSISGNIAAAFDLDLTHEGKTVLANRRLRIMPGHCRTALSVAGDGEKEKQEGGSNEPQELQLHGFLPCSSSLIGLSDEAPPPTANERIVKEGKTTL